MNVFKRFFVAAKNHKKILAVIFVLILIFGFIFLRPKPAVVTETTKVSQGNIISVLSLTGTISSENTAKLTFQSGGKLTYLPFKKGDFVKQYQTVAGLDTRSVRENLQNSLIDFSKQRNTFDQTLDSNNAKSPTDAASVAIKRVLENNQYDLNKSINSVELQNLILENSYLVSPIAGIITSEDVTTVGVNVTAASSITISDPNDLSVSMDVDEADISKVRTGEKVNMILDAFPNDPIRLVVDSIDFVSHTNSTGSTVFGVKAKLAQKGDYDYKIGMSGDAEIIVDEKFNVIKIPTSAIVDENFVYIRRNKNLFEKVQIKTGIQSDTETEVFEGLNLGEEVAITPTSNIPLVKK